MVYLGEFIGTAILILLCNGVVANGVLTGTKGHNSGWIVIATGWGIAVAMAVYAMGWLSGAHINPAVTFGLAVGRHFEWALVPGYFLAQIAGAAFGSFLVYLCYLQFWALADDPTLKLAVHSTIPAVRGYGFNFLHWVAQRGTQSTRLGTSDPASRTSCFRSLARARPTGRTAGCRSWRHCSAVDSPGSHGWSFPRPCSPTKPYQPMRIANRVYRYESGAGTA